MNALEAENLHSFYGKSHILHGVSLHVQEGEIVTLLGRNGAGKTTTLRSLVGLTPPRQGTVKLFGAVVSGQPPYRITASGLGYVPEGRRIFPGLTVEENLKVPVERPGPFTIPRIYQLFPRLEQRRTNKGRQLSGGEQEMLAISRALLLNPKVLLLDEPSQGLAPLVVQHVFKIVASMRESGISVLLVEQNVRAAVAMPALPASLPPTKRGSVLWPAPARKAGKARRTDCGKYFSLGGPKAVAKLAPCRNCPPSTSAASPDRTAHSSSPNCGGRRARLASST